MKGRWTLKKPRWTALVETQFASVPPFRPEPESAHVKAALDLLQKAERPIIVAGGGVRASGAGRELVALAEALQIPVATSLNGKDIIPGIHPLSVGVVGSYSRETANRAVNRADLVCFIGSETGGMTTHFWAVPKIGTPAIQIDIEAEVAWSKLSVAGERPGRCQERTGAHAGPDRQIERGQARALDQGNFRAARRVVREIQADADFRRVPIHPARICGDLTQHCRTTPLSWSIPAMPACGWAACTICASRRRAISAAPAIWAGRFRPALAPRRRAGAACGGFHRRRRLLVPHCRNRNGGALEHQQRHDRQQQRRRQPVEARL